MKKYTIIILGLLICLALVSAGSIPILIERWNDDLNITSIQEDRIKLSTNVIKIDVDISPIQCNDIECYATISQPNVIHTEWRRNKNYCFKYSSCNETEPTNQSCIAECLTYKDYTIKENQESIKEYVSKRLGDYADAEEIRKGDNKGDWESKDDG